MLVGCATAAAFFPFVGAIIYMILRPPEYLEDVRERELEVQAAEARLHQLDQSLCPHCDYRIEPDFVRCPSCLRKLKERCANCSRPLDQAWTICPYCEADVPGLSAPRSRRRRSTAEREERGAAGDREGSVAAKELEPETAAAGSRRRARGADTLHGPGLQPRRPHPAHLLKPIVATRAKEAMDRTLILVKPDAFARGLSGEILARFERKGLRIVALRHMTVTRDLAERHYAEHAERPFFGELVDFITSGPIVAMVLEGADAVEGSPAGDRRDQPARGGPGQHPRRLRRSRWGPTWCTARTRPSRRPARPRCSSRTCRP